MARAATHAGSWYKKEARELNIELDSYLNRVPTELEGICSNSVTSGPVPVPGARAIIAPYGIPGSSSENNTN
jgi:predicted class III extradiol MEMO1 family dioxygenase